MIEGIALAVWCFRTFGTTSALWYWGVAAVVTWALCGFFSRGRNDEFEALVARREPPEEEEEMADAAAASSSSCGPAMLDCQNTKQAGADEATVIAHPYVRRSSSGGSLEIFAEVPRCDVNPWVNATWRVTASERLKISLGAPWLIPARVGLILLAILNAVVFANIATLGWNGRPNVEPRGLLRWRPAFLERALRNFRRGRLRRVRDVTREGDRLVGSDQDGRRRLVLPDTAPVPRWRKLLGLPVMASVQLILWGVGFWRVRVIGREHLTSEARVVVCNHVSMIEPVLLLMITGATPVTSSEFAKLPGLGPVGRLYQLLWLDRGSVPSRQAVIETIGLRCADREFPPVLVFPEGTTLNGRALISFKNGAFAPGMPVQPVVARFPYQVVCGLGLDCSWTTAGPQFVELSIRMMMQPWNRLELEFLPAYRPSARERAEAPLFAANVRDVMAAALEAPTTEHSWADMWLNMTARKLGEPPHRTLVSLGALKTFLGGRTYERERAAKALERFATADVEKDGKLTLRQFRDALRGEDDDDLPPLLAPERLLDRDAVDALFRLLSRGSQTVDFFSFLVGFALLDVPDESDTDSALRLVFALLDVACEGVVRESRVCAAFEARRIGPVSEEDTEFVDDDAFVRTAAHEDDTFLTEDDFVKFVKANRRDIRQALLQQQNNAQTLPPDDDDDEGDDEIPTIDA